MAKQLFDCETLDPQDACAVARYLGSPVEFPEGRVVPRGEGRA